MKIIKFLVILFFAGALTLYCLVVFTSFPIQLGATLLNQIDGVNIQGAKGSIKEGFAVQKLELFRNEDEGEISVVNLVADYSLKPKKINGKKFIHVKNINADEIILIGSRKPESNDQINESEDKKLQKDNVNDDSAKHSNDLDDLGLQVDNVSIKNVVLKTDSDSDGFLMENLTIKNLFADEEGLKFEKLDIKSNYLDLNGKSNLLDKEGRFRVELEGIIKNKMLERLKEDLKFSVTLDIKGKRIKLDATAFKNLLSLNMHPKESGLLQFSNLSIANKFENDWPITWLDGKFKLPNTLDMDYKKVKPIGTVYFRSQDKIYKIKNDTFSIKTKNKLIVSFQGLGEGDNILFTYTRERNESSYTITEI